MSYYNQGQPPVGVPPPQGYPKEGYGYPPPPAGGGYPYPPPQQQYPPQYAPPQYAPPQYSNKPPQRQNQSSDCLDACLAALCCCFVLEVCF
ncbi:hypothetical protein R6Q59_019410 [Mikania micrantha]